MLSSLKVFGKTMRSSYLDRTLRTSRKRCWKKRWVGRRRRRGNNLGIHWNSLSTAGRGVISSEGFKQAISGTAPLPTHLLTHIQSCISKPFTTSDIYLSTPQHSTLVQSPSGSVNLRHGLLTDEGWVGVSVALVAGENGCTGCCP